MENRNSYTIVGMFFMACLTAFAIFIWWMTSKNNTKVDFKEYYIHTTELPSGLKVDSTVKFIGVPAGSVSDINFVDDKNALINITMKIREDLPIKADSVASIEVQAISGVASINISRGTKDFTSGQKPILQLEESLFSKLGNNAENITLKINQTLDKVDNFFSPENIAHVESVLKNIDKFTQVLTDEEGLSEVDSIVKNVKNFTDTLNKTDTKELVKNLNRLISNANQVFISANSAITGYNSLQELITKKAKDGEYDLRNTVGPLLREASDFLNGFDKTLREFRGALQRLEDNPYEFFFTNPVPNDKGDKK
ncbi:MlaD family protein [Campylobacter concisus]|uniref:MlaD family protein n=1 Tax=Campylobacter concisus TaxID=199 RepID=UPI000CD99BFA|nr:MlaD family protein [Campylobacter concisus]QPH87999.1 MCE family protein [Campylobacter concisus]QPI02947.1 MCE family protein [Campylobacter concisus]